MDPTLPMPRAVVQIALGIVVQVLAISCWFATAAALPSLTESFDLDDAGRILLIAMVQLGFAIGAVGVGSTRLADRVRPGLLVPAGAALTALATFLPLLAPTSFALLCLSRVLAGVLLAAVYPAGMRCTVSWASPRWRGLAVAGVVGALTVGTAAPQLLRAAPIEDWRVALTVCAVAAGLAAVLGLALKDGPFVRPEHHRTSRPDASAQRRITVAYVGHMWEVYGLWVWLPALLVALPAVAGAPVGILAFLVIGAAGALGCVAGGVLAARHGKQAVSWVAVMLSAGCALMTPLLPWMPLPAVLAVITVWSAAAIADSPLYSALTGDVASPDRVGTAIALQMGVGYAVSVMAIAIIPPIAALIGWANAMAVLAVGPLLSAVVLRRPIAPPRRVG